MLPVLLADHALALEKTKYEFSSPKARGVDHQLYMDIIGCHKGNKINIIDG
jgi:hypothetical protein